MIEKTIGVNFRIFAAVKNVDIAEIHKSTGISKTTLYSFKNGEMKGIQLSTLEKLSEYFKVEVHEFFVKGDADE
ncbi:helix-turn-helix domain-containing protein [Macrococcoides canis]|uniref:helix-turn-helix domain-containing protein n=1 Tax=Macrococcoides canis TaxID=1855823 RepID=UPI0020B82193|nr:helix-turn-helix transcriptional regulator [Macrococcus canis]UTH10804.1 helix-turn-helix transcriptional regulator [Macrococcus canis]